MPTGYTAAVADGSITELEPFALELARGMGALVTMRDEPSGTPIPERLEPSPYYAKRAAELETKIASLRALSDEEAQAAADAAVADYQSRRDEAERNHTDTLNRYQAMLAKVVQWEGAPEGIKEFALEQLHRALEFDCGRPFRFWETAPQADGATWRENKLASIREELTSAQEESAKEQGRTDRRNAWLTQLRKSLASVDRSVEDGDAQKRSGIAKRLGK